MSGGILSKDQKTYVQKVYCCAECSRVEINDVTPLKEGCYKYSFHRWVNLGDIGEVSYACANCDITVHTKNIPSSYGCCGGDFHKWERNE